MIYNDADNIYLGAVEVDRVYVGTVEVWHNPLVLTIPQQSSELNLRTFINANNPTNRDDIILTNTLTQPSMVTGDLSGLDVVLTNTGEIQGSVSGGTGFTATSNIKLINNGWIRGAGGNGGKGGNGGNGGRGGTGVNNTYVVTTYQYNNPRWATGGSVDRICHNANHFGWNGSYITTSSGKPIGYGPMTIGGVPNIFKGAYVGTWSESVSGDRCDRTTVYAHKTERRIYTNKTRYGGAGGNGGTTGGGGGAGGAGQRYGVSASSGAAGAAGGAGSAGSASSPSGGKTGGTGGAKGKGGTGGTGGAWGTAGNSGGTGSTGVTGATGGGGGTSGRTSGSAGTGGSSGTAGGKSIIGTSYLLSGSVQGNLSGTTS